MNFAQKESSYLEERNSLRIFWIKKKNDAMDFRE